MPAAVGLSSVETIIAVGRHVAEAVGRRRELPSASAGGGCTHTHTHTHILSQSSGVQHWRETHPSTRHPPRTAIQQTNTLLHSRASTVLISSIGPCMMTFLQWHVLVVVGWVG
jgi:hypothetical protein